MNFENLVHFATRLMTLQAYDFRGRFLYYGAGLESIAIQSSPGQLSLYFDGTKASKYYDTLIQTMVVNPKKHFEEYTKLAANLQSCSVAVTKSISLSNNQKAIAFRNWLDAFTQFIVPVLAPFAIEYGLDDKCRALLKEEFGDSASEYFEIISSPTKLNNFQLMRLEIAKLAQSKKVPKPALAKLVKKFAWYGEYSFVEPLYGEKYFVGEIDKLSLGEAENEVKQTYELIELNKKRFSKLLSKIKSSELRNIALVINEYTSLRTKRIEEFKKSQSQIRSLYSWIAKEINTKISGGWSYDSVIWMTNDEILDFLTNGVVPELSTVLNRKNPDTVFYYDGNLRIASAKDSKFVGLFEMICAQEKKKYSLWGTRYFGLAFAQGYFDYSMESGAEEMYITCVGEGKATYVVKAPQFDNACLKIGKDFLKSSDRFLSNYVKLKKIILASAKNLSNHAGVVSDEKLNQMFEKHWKLTRQFQPVIMFPHYLERMVEPYLQKKYPSEFSIISSLSAPNEYLLMQKMLFEKSSKQVAKEFGWLSVISMAEEPYDEKYFEKYKKIVNKKQIEASFKQIKQNNILFKKILSKLDKSDRKMAEILNRFVFLRTDRMDFWKKQSYELYPFLKYVVQKVSPSFGIKEGSMLSWQEISSILSGTMLVSNEDLIRRGKRETCSIIFTKKGIEFYYDEETKKRILALLDSGNNIDEVKGIIACKGIVSGRVKLYSKQADVLHTDREYILVCGHTTPQDLPIMKRAKGIVTNEGGVTSHAAIVARELGVPCIVGTKNATKVLKDGDLVEVDANKGTVKVLEKKK